MAGVLAKQICEIACSMSKSDPFAQANGGGNASVQALRLVFNKETTIVESMGLYTAEKGFSPASTTATVLTLQEGPQASSWVQSAEVGDSQWCLCRYDTAALKWVVVYLSQEHYYNNKAKKTPMQLGKFHNVDTFFNAKSRVDQFSKSLRICLGPAPEFVACGTDGAWSFMHGIVGETQEHRLGVFVNTAYAKWQKQEGANASFVAFLGNAWQSSVMKFTSTYHQYDDDATLFIADFSKDDLANVSDPPVHFVTDKTTALDMAVNGRIVQESWHTLLSRPNALQFPAQAATLATPQAATQATPHTATNATPQATPHTAPHATPQAATHATPQAATHATPQAATHSTPQATTGSSASQESAQSQRYITQAKSDARNTFYMAEGVCFPPKQTQPWAARPAKRFEKEGADYDPVLGSVIASARHDKRAPTNRWDRPPMKSHFCTLNIL